MQFIMCVVFDSIKTMNGIMCLWLSYRKKIKKYIFASLKTPTKEVGSRVGSGFINQRYGSADSHQKVTDPQHCYLPIRD
jgi:hypothetical protein